MLLSINRSRSVGSDGFGELGVERASDRGSEVLVCRGEDSNKLALEGEGPALRGLEVGLNDEGRVTTEEGSLVLGLGSNDVVEELDDLGDELSERDGESTRLRVVELALDGADNVLGVGKGVLEVASRGKGAEGSKGVVVAERVDLAIELRDVSANVANGDGDGLDISVGGALDDWGGQGQKRHGGSGEDREAHFDG